MRFAHDFEIAAKPHRNFSFLISHFSFLISHFSFLTTRL